MIRTKKRERLRAFLAGHGIATGIHYNVPLPRHPAFREFVPERETFPVAERACGETISLPLWPGMPEEMLNDVA